MSLTLLSLATITRYNPGCHRTQLLCADPEETLPRRLYFSDAALFFITADSSALTEEYLTQIAWQSPFKAQTTDLEILILPSSTDQPTELSNSLTFEPKVPKPFYKAPQNSKVRTVTGILNDSGSNFYLIYGY